MRRNQDHGTPHPFTKQKKQRKQLTGSLDTARLSSYGSQREQRESLSTRKYLPPMSTSSWVDNFEFTALVNKQKLGILYSNKNLSRNITHIYSLSLSYLG